MTNYNDGNWHRWSGEEMKPASIHQDSEIEYVWHDEERNTSGTTIKSKDNRTMWVKLVWKQILKFRVLKEYRAQGDLWIDLDNLIVYTSYKPGTVWFRQASQDPLMTNLNQFVLDMKVGDRKLVPIDHPILTRRYDSNMDKVLDSTESLHRLVREYNQIESRQFKVVVYARLNNTNEIYIERVEQKLFLTS